MRVLVTGGREFYNKLLLKRTLDALHARKKIGPLIISASFELKGADIPVGPITCLIQGGANGADFLANHWATAYSGVHVEKYKYELGGTSKQAGHVRNLMMLVQGKPDLVVAFSGGKGTNDMKRQARKAGVKVLEIEDDSNS